MSHLPWGRLGSALLVLVALSGFAAAEAAAPPAVSSTAPPAGRVVERELMQDSLLVGLVHEALERRPELSQAQAMVEAEYARVPQARSMPDPVLALGIQNDGLQRLRIGEMETSWWSAAATQTFPWIGKRALRGRAQTLTARQSEADLERARLSVRAEVERAYVDLLLVRDQLPILGKLQGLWVQAEGMARARYEVGEGAQTDILRAQLERNRLEQQRWSLQAEERRRVFALDRAVGRAIGEPIPTAGSLVALRDPALPDSAQAEAEAMAGSPELRKARLGVEQAGALLSLARRDVLPDLTVTGGVMPRGGEFETMWQAGLSLPIPLWASGKQSRAVRETRLRGEAAQGGAEAIARLLRQRLEERRAVLAALLQINHLYRSGLLIQSEATVSSAMAQYQVGRLPFVSVLETLSGYLTDQVGYLESVAATQRVDIASRELSLDPVPGAAAGGFGGGSMPGPSGAAGAPAPAAAPGTSGATPATPRM